MTRTLETSDKLTIEALDKLGPGGAHHLYRISGYTVPRGAEGEKAIYPRDLESRLEESEQIIETYLTFQNGPIAEAGVNGITHEALLAVLINRLQGFQTGPFANSYNGTALAHLRFAQDAL